MWLDAQNRGIGRALATCAGALGDADQGGFCLWLHCEKEDTASSDIDLMLVSGTLTFSDTILVLRAATELLGREVNLNILTL